MKRESKSCKSRKIIQIALFSNSKWTYIIDVLYSADSILHIFRWIYSVFTFRTIISRIYKTTRVRFLNFSNLTTTYDAPLYGETKRRKHESNQTTTCVDYTLLQKRRK